MHFEKYSNNLKCIDNKSIIDFAFQISFGTSFWLSFGCLLAALRANRVDAVLPIVKIMWSPL